MTTTTENDEVKNDEVKVAGATLEEGNKLSFKTTTADNEESEEACDDFDVENPLESIGMRKRGGKNASALPAISKRLSVTSQKYDLDGDGKLDDAELAMREMDTDNRGYLTNDKVYKVMIDQMNLQREVFNLKRMAQALVLFIFILSLAMLGTSFAAATLAKDTDVVNGNLVVKSDGSLVATRSRGSHIIATVDGSYVERVRRRMLGFETADDRRFLQEERGVFVATVPKQSVVDAFATWEENGTPISVSVTINGIKHTELIAGSGLAVSEDGTWYRGLHAQEVQQPTYDLYCGVSDAAAAEQTCDAYQIGDIETSSRRRKLVSSILQGWIDDGSYIGNVSYKDCFDRSLAQCETGELGLSHPWPAVDRCVVFEGACRVHCPQSSMFDHEYTMKPWSETHRETPTPANPSGIYAYLGPLDNQDDMYGVQQEAEIVYDDYGVPVVLYDKYRNVILSPRPPLYTDEELDAMYGPLYTDDDNTFTKEGIVDRVVFDGDENNLCALPNPDLGGLSCAYREYEYVSTTSLGVKLPLRRDWKTKRYYSCYSPCFSAVATVFVPGKGVVAMQDLQVGDKVLSANNRFQTVFTFTHMDRIKPSVFLQIYTESSETPLELSGKHMLFIQGKANPIPALLLKVGDAVAGANGPRVVTKIGSVVREGFYAPHTTDGTIMVDGILASAYTSFQGTEYLEIFGVKTVSHQTFHDIVNVPFRKFCMGVSMDLCNKYTDEDGHSFWDHVGKQIVHLCEKQNILVQVAMYSFLTILVLVAYVVLSSSALTILLAGYVVLKFMKCQKWKRTGGGSAGDMKVAAADAEGREHNIVDCPVGPPRTPCSIAMNICTH
jgi:hypothetical protein